MHRMDGLSQDLPLPNYKLFSFFTWHFLADIFPVQLSETFTIFTPKQLTSTKVKCKLWFVHQARTWLSLICGPLWEEYCCPSAWTLIPWRYRKDTRVKLWMTAWNCYHLWLPCIIYSHLFDFCCSFVGVARLAELNEELFKSSLKEWTNINTNNISKAKNKQSIHRWLGDANITSPLTVLLLSLIN